MAADAGSVPSRRRTFHARVLEATSFAELARELERTASEPEGVGIMTRKGRTFAVRLDGVSLKAAPLLKQELLAVGGDSAHARGVADHSIERTDVVLLATWGQFQRLLPKLERQPFQLGAIAVEVGKALRAYVARRSRPLVGARRTVAVGARTLVMGVVNVTPDSFSDGGSYLLPDAAVAHAERLAIAGADVIDLGAESTRPGAAPVPPDTEWARLEPVLMRLAPTLRVPISVDTRSPEVAERALAAGADWVNDVGGLRDPAMRALVARTSAPIVVMHLRGTPATMQDDTEYADLRGEVFGALADATALAIADGIRPEQIVVDPGLGFGKTAAQSLELLAHVGELRSLGFPVLVGASRKSFLGQFRGGATPAERTDAGVAAAVIAALHGADLVRTHDVEPTVKALGIADAVRSGRFADAAPDL